MYESHKWLAETWWTHINANIDVTKDFRYLGAHLTTAMNCTSSTLRARWQKAIAQLRRLKFAQATPDAKIKAIITKIFVAALYGVEAAEVKPTEIAKLTAAIIDVCTGRHNAHRADLFFATTGNEHQELDPAAQIFANRVLQTRRTSGKKHHLHETFQQSLVAYAEAHKVEGKWPAWFHDAEQADTEGPDTFPIAQPQPATRAYDSDYNDSISALGPIGLLVESIAWHGMVIDSKFRIWQSKETAIDIFNIPYQHLKSQVLMAAARARTKAEWERFIRPDIRVREIDRKPSKISEKLTDPEKASFGTS